MVEVEKKVYELIGKSTKKKVAESLGITTITLNTRLEKGGWLKSEIEIIESLIND